MIGLYLHNRLIRTTPAIMNLTPYAANWKRSTRTIGGYWAGTFTLSGLGWAELNTFFQTRLGCLIREWSYGMVSWEGIIYEMRLAQGGREYSRTLDAEWWHNRVAVVYGESGGGRGTVAWSENTDASAEYGECNYLVSLGTTTAASGTAVQSRHLSEFGWPRSRLLGGTQFGDVAGQPAPDAIEVTVLGLWSTLGWRYHETSESGQADTLLTTLIGESEFVTVGRIEANSLSTSLECSPIPKRIGDLVEDIVGLGDASGNVWQAGVYGGGQFIYEQAPTAVSHYLVDRRLTDLAGHEVVPSLLKPGFLLKALGSSLGVQPIGTSRAWDDPQVAYVEEVEFTRPNGLRLKLYGQEESLEILTSQIAGAPTMHLPRGDHGEITLPGSDYGMPDPGGYSDDAVGGRNYQ